MAEHEEGSEGEYFEQELLDFIDWLKRLKALVAGKQPLGEEPKEVLEALICRFKKTTVMPEDQYTRACDGLKELADIIYSAPHQFRNWDKNLTRETRSRVGGLDPI